MTGKVEAADQTPPPKTQVAEDPIANKMTDMQALEALMLPIQTKHLREKLNEIIKER